MVAAAVVGGDRHENLRAWERMNVLMSDLSSDADAAYDLAYRV